MARPEMRLLAGQASPARPVDGGFFLFVFWRGPLSRQGAKSQQARLLVLRQKPVSIQLVSMLFLLPFPF